MIKNIIFLSIIFLMTNNSFAEIAKKIVIDGNQRISEETIKLYGDIELNKDYKESDLDKLLKLVIDTINNNQIETNDNIDYSLDTILKILKEEKNKDPEFKLSLNNIHSFNISKYVIKKYGGVKKINKILSDEITKDTYIIL